MKEAQEPLGRGRRAFSCFLPAASPKALRSISRTVRRWAHHHRSDKSLQDLTEMYNPCIRGWINYYSHFYKTQLRPTLKRIDLYVIRCARLKFKRLRRKTKGHETGLTGSAEQIQPSSPTGSSVRETANIGSRMNREVHVRIWSTQQPAHIATVARMSHDTMFCIDF
jgi:hypothetical protein